MLTFIMLNVIMLNVVSLQLISKYIVTILQVLQGGYAKKLPIAAIDTAV
jgi:hypothetical protein